jgi:glutamate-1-semialdehyde aminotransferase/spore coat polysaccharide biosynthesis protein SpsF (cytidylyltransferase family)
MGSSRLPGKVMADLGGMPVLAWVTRAARATPGVDDIIVATSTSPSDDVIDTWCRSNNVQVYRGSEGDVLDRFVGALRATAANIVVRLTADCPLLDPHVIAETIRLRDMTGSDYACNTDPPTWPNGLDCEVVTADALLIAAAEARQPSDREHVTPFVRNNRARFSMETLISSLPRLDGERWSLDLPKDLAFLREIVNRLPNNRIPSYLDILALLDREPALRSLNQGIDRDAGYAAAFAADGLTRKRSYAGSQAMLERAERVIPLGSQTFSKSRIQFPPDAAPLFVTHGDGGRVFDVDGNDYVDLINALLPNVLGYRDPDVDLAIRRQLNRGISFSLPNPIETELAERLVKHIPCAEMVRFGKNGTDATSAAVRLARAFTRRDRLMLLGYHGWQDWYVGATSRKLGVPEAVCALSHMVPYGDLDRVEALFLEHPGEFAAVILEPMNICEPPAGYLEALKHLVHKNGALIVFDEIITGFRWGLGGAQARYGVTPDLACFGKAMGNGMPISAVVGRADVLRLMEDIFYSGTFAGEAPSLAAAIATIDKMERENVAEWLWQVGGSLMKTVRQKIAAVGLADVIDLVGAPPFAILAYKDHSKASKEEIKTLFLREMIAAGVLVNASHNLCFAHSASDIAWIDAAYDQALAVLREALDCGDINSRLGSQVIRPIFNLRAVS